MGSLLCPGSVKGSTRARSFSKTTFTWSGANWTTSWAKAATAARATAIGNIPRIAYCFLDTGTRYVLQGSPSIYCPRLRREPKVIPGQPLDDGLHQCLVVAARGPPGTFVWSC